MDIERSFEILDLHPGVSLKEAKQAYRDLVRVWHPKDMGARHACQAYTVDTYALLTNCPNHTFHPING